MPPKMKKNILVMITNVGSSSLEQHSLDEEPFLDKAKYAMKLLVEKKLFIQPKDEIGIITMGDETDNSEDIDNVKVYCEHLVVPNFEMVKYITDLTSTNFSSNWIEALHVALCFIRKEVVEPKSKVTLVIFNNFKEDEENINQYDSNNIISDLKNFENLHLLFIHDNPNNDKSSKKTISASEKFAMSIVSKASAQFKHINDFINIQQFFVSPPTSSVPWRVNLEYAGLQIPCATYVKVTDTVKLGSWKMQAVTDADNSTKFQGTSNVANDSTKFQNMTNVVKENVMMNLHRNEIKAENIIKGYKFGGKYIPFSEEDETAMKYGGSTRSLMVHSFVSQNEVKLEYWTGSGSRIIVPATSDDSSAFYSFVQAMVELEYVAIVRKVYGNNNLPKMGVLFPKVDDDDIWCLVHLELPFANDVRCIQKRTVKSCKTVDEKKLEALDKFIDSMTISDNEQTYLNPGMFPNVRNQYHWNALAERALKPDGSLLRVNEYIQKYLIPPEKLSVQAKPYLEQLNKLFDIHKTNSDLTKEPKSVFTKLKSNDNEDNVDKLNNEVSKHKDSTDEGFFSPEDVDLKMEELDDM